MNDDAGTWGGVLDTRAFDHLDLVLGPKYPERVVLCHGCWDILHLGHIRHLQEARKLGDRLIVSITADAYVNKGPGRPRFTQKERAEMLSALDCVDEVIISESHNAVNVINRIRPTVFVKGGDYADSRDEQLMQEKAAVEALGGWVHFTQPTPWHSSELIGARSAEVEQYLDGARRFLPAIQEAFEKARKLRALFVGERIIDDYRYVRTLGKSSKEPLVATVLDQTEEFSGGVVAAYHNGGAVCMTELATEGHIRKTRFVSTDYNRKLFEIYSGDRIKTSHEKRARFHVGLAECVEEFDLVVVLDFGHGLIDRDTREILSRAKFLAVNAQSNAANYGFNPVTKYAEADYVCVDEPEARLATRMKHEPIDEVMLALSRAIDCRDFIVTHGQHGTNTLNVGGATPSALSTAASAHVPVFSTAAVVDTMGAGDAFLAVTAPLIAAGLDLEAAAIVGNVAGAIKCGIVGHRRSITRDELVRGVEDLLK